MSQSLRCVISGRVQGVCYRASTQQKAIQWAITGYVRNLSDGRVEVLMYGDAGSLEKLKEWCWQGPPAAKVTGVQCENVALDALSNLPEAFVIE